MQISIDNAEFQTIIFGIIFILGLILSIRRVDLKPFFGKSRTEELKGFAILVVIFSHIGYFLVTDTRFLYPFSVLAGVGVNLFLFLSGFGLTLSALKNSLSPFAFYKKRLGNLFLPMWIVVISLIAADFIFLHKSYPGLTILQTLFGFFPYADIFKSLDSPLWYFSLILFYYLIFPLFFWKKFAYLCPVFLWIVGFFVLRVNLPINPDVLNLYKLHFIAFPLGVLFANLYTADYLISFRQQLKRIIFANYFRYIFIILAAAAFVYFSINSGVGKGKDIEQMVSITTMFLVIFLFITKGFEFKIFNLFGKYSYIIYLIHWPILARYGLIYNFVPAYLATYLYLLIFLVLGWVITKLTRGMV